MDVKITDKWDEYLNFFPDEKKDIYFTESYVKLYEDKESTALCIVCQENNNILLMPFLRRKICGYSAAPNNAYDFETAYGYGGPIANVDDIRWITNALTSMNQYFAEQGYICGFVRFHPLLNNQDFCKQSMEVLHDRQTIAIDTCPSEKEIWTKQIISKNRNMIRKAEKNGCIYKAEYDLASLKEFVALYNETMKRLSADSFYFFSDEYYNQFIHHLNGKAFLGTVRKDGKLICAALFMYSEDYGHYHLEGSDRNYSSLGANNLLLWKTACEMKKLGVSQFHLGGGYNPDPENSLFKFKKSFSSNVKEFYIGKDIFNIKVYDAIINEWQEKNADKVELYGNRLLRYRCG